jgi:hypothetical protein
VCAIVYAQPGLTASKSVLIRSAGLVGNLYAPSLAHRTVVKIDIGALVEAVMQRLTDRRRKIIMDISEERGQRHLARGGRHVGW